MKRKSPFHRPRRIEADYQRALFDFLRDPGIDPDQYAELIARQMVSATLKQNAQGWRAAAAKSTKSRLISRLLQDELQGTVGLEVRRLVRENALLIRSLPQTIAGKTAAYIAEQQQRGVRSETIEAELRKRDIPATSARLIARTETAKAETALTRARAQDIGIEWYQWATSEDQRVRHSHELMDGVLCRFNDAPAPEALAGERSTLGHYPPGGTPNCRCLALPLVSLDEVSWPRKVYYNGSIQRMSRAAFMRIAA
jgi:SPP1 gp7 family putative phage head morphogenesis protein